MPAGEDFAAFAASARPRLYRSMYAVAGDPRDAEDAVQSALADASTHWERVRRAGDPMAYARRMALNALLTHRRRAWWSRELLDAGAAGERRPQPGDLADEASTRLTVLEAVGGLPPRQRAIVVLRYYDDLSEAQIADALGCRPGTVKSQAAAALTTLRRTLGAFDLEPEETR